jgi:hypothetical protein
MAEWGWTNVLKQPLGQPRYWETLNLLYSEIQVIYSFILDGSVAGSNMDHELLHYVNFLKSVVLGSFEAVSVPVKHTLCFSATDIQHAGRGDMFGSGWTRHIRRNYLKEYDWLRDLLISIPPVMLRTDSASWSHLTWLSITFNGHTTLGRLLWTCDQPDATLTWHRNLYPRREASSVSVLNRMDVVWRRLKEHVNAFPARTTAGLVERFQAALTKVEATDHLVQSRPTFPIVFERMPIGTLPPALNGRTPFQTATVTT